MRGLVLFGINSIFTVRCGAEVFECRFKGKKLKGWENWYNPLAPGDEVEVAPDSHSPGKGLILSRYERRNYFSRWNKKSGTPQVLAANIDLVIPVFAAARPPFRPRFLDRVLVMAHQAGLPCAVAVNKIDEGIPESVEERLLVYEGLSYVILRCSAHTGEGLQALKDLMRGKRVVFVGASGTGKSSLINALMPEAGRRIGAISEKFNRGNHTTCFAILVEGSENAEIIDTPGVREVHVYGIKGDELRDSFPEFRPLAGQCGYSGCIHFEEEACAVKEAIRAGTVDPERYESYARMLLSLKEMGYEGN